VLDTDVKWDREVALLDTSSRGHKKTASPVMD
jgi:hypothetical protein